VFLFIFSIEFQDEYLSIGLLNKNIALALLFFKNSMSIFSNNELASR